MMLKQGIHPGIVQERLGHSTISTTLDTYPHVAPGLQQAAAIAFDDILKKDSNLDKQLAEILQN
jgi:integrase